MGTPKLKKVTLPVRGLLEVTVAVIKNDWFCATLAFEVESVIDVAAGDAAPPAPAPLPPDEGEALLPTPQPSAKFRRQNKHRLQTARFLLRPHGDRNRTHEAKPLTRLIVQYLLAWEFNKPALCM